MGDGPGTQLAGQKIPSILGQMTFPDMTLCYSLLQASGPARTWQERDLELEKNRPLRRAGWRGAMFIKLDANKSLLRGSQGWVAGRL